MVDSVPWNFIHDEIERVARTIVEAGDFDAAVFQAFKYIEGELQERVGNEIIGINLVNQAFNGPSSKILISTSTREQENIAQLFAGALGSIRNDRGHKKTPNLPCKSIATCWQYLGFASMLIHILSCDKNQWPIILSTEVFGNREHSRVEIVGKNFGRAVRVLGRDETEFVILAATSTMIRVALPPGYQGYVRVAVGDAMSEPAYCDSHTLENGSVNSYEILETDIPVYSDAACTIVRPNVVAMRVMAIEGGRKYVQIQPVRPGAYKAGVYIKQGSYANETVRESWYKDTKTRDIACAWSWARVANPKVIGAATGEVKLGGMTLLPKKIRCQPGEPRILRVIAWGTDGQVRKEIDITDGVTWTSSDEDVAYVKDGVLYPKRAGDAEIRCAYRTLASAAGAEVSHIVGGDKAVVLQGMRGLQKLRFDASDNLYFCNQGPSIYRIARSGSGGLREVLRLATPKTFSRGINDFLVA